MVDCSRRAFVAAMRFGDQPQPRGKPPSGSEQRSIRHRGGDRANANQANSEDRGPPPTSVTGAMPRNDACLKILDRSA